MTVKQVTSIDGFGELQSDKNSLLIDVRTKEEITFVGFVDATKFENRMLLLPWQIFPRMDENVDFINILSDWINNNFSNKNSADIKLFFLCRSGGRSNMAAHFAFNNGYKNCYNIINGFEGDLNSNFQRGVINGWKASNLPWKQT